MPEIEYEPVEAADLSPNRSPLIQFKSTEEAMKSKNGHTPSTLLTPVTPTESPILEVSKQKEIAQEDIENENVNPKNTLQNSKASDMGKLSTPTHGETSDSTIANCG